VAELLLAALLELDALLADATEPDETMGNAEALPDC